MPRFRLPFLIALMLPLLGGCLGGDFPSMATTSPSQEPLPQQARQFILRFRDGRDERAARQALPELERVAGVSLEYVRPMAGQAHVLRFASTATAEQVDRVLGALGAMPGVEYVEPDSMVRHP